MDSLTTVNHAAAIALGYRAGSLHPLHWGHGMDNRIARAIADIVSDRAETILDVDKMRDAIYSICEYACPIVDANDPALLSIFSEPGHIQSGRRTTGKPGKLLGKLLPGATQKEKESFAVWWKENIVLPRDGLVIRQTECGEKIAAVYTGNQARSSDPSLSARGWKSLAASCMRYTFLDLPQHPVTVYGSSDFRLYWVENSGGDIAARVIVAIRNGRFVPGPIYCNSNIAGDLLEKHLAAEKIKPREGKSVDSDSWINCRLLRIEHNGGLIVPYLDMQQDATDTGESIRLCSRHNGDFSLDSTSGLVYECGGYVCDGCDDRLSEDDMYSDDHGACYCESCYFERYTICDHCQDTTPHDDMVSILDWRGRTVDCACSYCANSGDIDCAEIDGDFYDLDSVVFDVDGDAYVMDSGTYFVSDLTGEIYSTDLLHTLPNGDSCTIEEAFDTGNWTLVTDRIFAGTYDDPYTGIRYESFKTVPRLVLKPWLELDARGDVINRQPELFPVGLPGEQVAVVFNWNGITCA